MAATLENERVGHRSGVSPVRGSVVSQNHRKVRAWTVSRNGSSRGTPPATGAVTSATGRCAVEQAPADAVARKRTRAARHRRAAP
jgi:hypothetical protein